MSYQPPDDIWQVNVELHPGEPLDGDRDPRWVDTAAARGDYNLGAFYQRLGLSGGVLKSPPDQGYYLFCGHRGSGKSTELRRMRNQLHADDGYYVVFADVTEDLDVNNLRYADVLLHLAGRLAEQLAADETVIEHEHLRELNEWFSERVEKRASTRQFALEARAGFEGQLGLPGFARLFARFSDTIKTNSTYKDELRLVLRNTFSDFAGAFNHLIEAAQDRLPGNDGRRILFIVDGTDRLGSDDAEAFFRNDVYQLQQIRSLFVYCAPVHLTYEASLGQSFNHVFRLPMVKVADPDGRRNDLGIRTMREMLFKRASSALFDAGVADILIEASGGHARDLLRLLHNAFMYSTSGRFDRKAAEQAVNELAKDFLRILNVEDYAVLVRMDAASTPPPITDQTRQLLYNLALLEYNNFYWRSHPAIRTLDHYRQAVDAADTR